MRLVMANHSLRVAERASHLFPVLVSMRRDQGCSASGTFGNGWLTRAVMSPVFAAEFYSDMEHLKINI